MAIDNNLNISPSNKNGFKFLLFIASLLTPLEGSSQTHQPFPISVIIKLDSIYETIHPKKYYNRQISDEGLVVSTEMIRQIHYDITVEIKNISHKSITIWLMKCSWEDNFLINNDYIYFYGRSCDSNFPIRVQFKPGEAKLYTTTMDKSIKFDYPCQDCVYGPQVNSTKVGLIIIDDFFANSSKAFDYFITMKDKSKWNIVWSNPLFLIGKN